MLGKFATKQHKASVALTSGLKWENIIFALLVKVLVLVLAGFGFVNMWVAVFADVGVSLIAILNAMRLMQEKEK